MLRDNLVWLIEPMSSSAGVDPLALCLTLPASSDDRPPCLENPRPEGAESTLAENARSPFQAEPKHRWGIEIIGAELAAISQSQPARLEIFRTETDVRQLSAAYKTLQKSSAGVAARAEVNYDRVVFRFMDQWSVKGAVLSLHRRVEITGNSPGGFDSAMTFQLPPSVGWSEINYMAPGALYGDPT